MPAADMVSKIRAKLSVGRMLRRLYSVATTRLSRAFGSRDRGHDASRHIDEKLQQYSHYCCSCSRECHGVQSSKLCCICLWSQAPAKLASDTIDGCRDCMNDLRKVIKNADFGSETEPVLPPPYSIEPASTYKRFPKACGHDQCILTLNCCCHCSDKRPIDIETQTYIDGKGMIPASRSSTYCTYCRDISAHPVFAVPNFRRFATRPLATPVPATIEPPERAVSAPASSKKPQPASTQKLPKTCGHKYCDLTISTCCACTDKREQHERENDVKYVDGRWWVAVGGRWGWGYCPPCRELQRAASMKRS